MKTILLVLGIAICTCSCAHLFDKCYWDLSPCLHVDEIRSKAEGGDARAQAQMGVIYRNGTDDVPVDYEKAIYWFRRAFESGYAKAAYQLGNLYLDTDGMQHDYSQVVHWWRLAAEQGEWDAQHNLADLYFIGEHIPQDYGEAIYWWRKASEEFCDGGAEERLGDIYYEGLGAPQDYEEAAKWYRKSAENTNEGAMNKLVYMQMNGELIPQDWSEAYIWSSRAQYWSCNIFWRTEEKCRQATELHKHVARNLSEENVSAAEERIAGINTSRRYPPSCQELPSEN